MTIHFDGHRLTYVGDLVVFTLNPSDTIERQIQKILEGCATMDPNVNASLAEKAVEECRQYLEEAVTWVFDYDCA